MSDFSAQSFDHFAQHGYVMLQGVFSVPEIDALAQRLSSALEMRHDASILQSRGKIYGSRNLLETFPEIASLMRQPSLNAFSTAILGADAGIVRALFFDKPPDRSWSLPWHKDRTIAVKRNDLPSELFHKPTLKAGVPHVEAPSSVLEKMLTIRIHLDAMTETNGPLHVVPGSHVEVGQEHHDLVVLQAEVGDVLAMRPLLTHSSTVSMPGSSSHRRVIHIETAASAQLPDGYEWHSFVALQ
jgi:hypothetical protein